MATEIIMPVFGFTQEESEIVNWLAKEGEKVDKGDPVAEVTTDKVNMEVEAPASGIFGGLQYDAGVTVPVTSVIAFILEPGEEAPEVVPQQVALKPPENNVPASSSPHPTPSAPPPVSVPSPRFSEGAASDLQSLTPLARKVALDQGLDVSGLQGSGPGGVIMRRDVEALRDISVTASLAAPGGKLRATPSARRLARELGVGLASLKGSGPRGRIQATDVSASSSPQPTRARLPNIEDPNLKRVPFSTMRRTISQRLQQSAQEAPHIYFQKGIGFDALLNLTKKLNKGKDKADKVSVTAALTKLVAHTLKVHPNLNSHLGDNELLQYSRVNIGMAVALDDGLIVPVIHDVNERDLESVSAAVRDLAVRARSGKLKPEELQGATFSISNLGMFGIDKFTAIINPPEVAILAVGVSREIFVPEKQGKPQVVNVAELVLSVDHRAIDGAVAAAFMQELKSNCEDQKVLKSVLQGK